MRHRTRRGTFRPGPTISPQEGEAERFRGRRHPCYSQIIAAELKLTQPTGLSSIVAIESTDFRARFLGFMDPDLDTDPTRDAGLLKLRPHVRDVRG